MLLRRKVSRSKRATFYHWGMAAVECADAEGPRWLIPHSAVEQLGAVESCFRNPAMVLPNRRHFLQIIASGVCLHGASHTWGTEAEAEGYVRANTDWLANCRFGIGIHWTAHTVPRSGSAKPFQKAVADFDLKGFLAAVEYAGADYVLFTSTHALQMLPAPHPVLDKILPGRTCERDLIAELADGLAAKQKPCWSTTTIPATQRMIQLWEQAVGYHAPNKDRFARTILIEDRIVDGRTLP